jgi:hypothetical protein
MPADLTFPDAIKAAEELLAGFEEASVKEPEFVERLSSLVSTQTAARGFFVAFLTGTFACSEDPPADLLSALAQHATIVCDLLARNLVMSITMAMTHERKGDGGAAAASQMVAARVSKLIKEMREEPDMAANLDEMRRSLAGQNAKFSDFLKRWQYDQEQLKAALEAVQSVI